MSKSSAKKLAGEVAKLSSKSIVDSKKIFVDAFCELFAAKLQITTDNGPMSLLSTRKMVEAYLKNNVNASNILKGINAAGGGLVFGLGMAGTVIRVAAAMPAGGPSSLIGSALSLSALVGVGAAMGGLKVISPLKSLIDAPLKMHSMNDKANTHNAFRNTNIYVLNIHIIRAAHELADSFEYQITCLNSPNQIKKFAFIAVERAWKSFSVEADNIKKRMKQQKSDKAIEVTVSSGSIITGILDENVRSGCDVELGTREESVRWKEDVFFKAGIVDRQYDIVTQFKTDVLTPKLNYYSSGNQKSETYGYRARLFNIPDDINKAYKPTNLQFKGQVFSKEIIAIKKTYNDFKALSLDAIKKELSGFVDIIVLEQKDFEKFKNKKDKNNKKDIEELKKENIFVFGSKEYEKIKQTNPSLREVNPLQPKDAHINYQPHAIKVQDDFIHSFLSNAKDKQNINHYLKQCLGLNQDDRDVQVVFRGNLSTSRLPNNKFKKLDGFNFDGSDLSYSVLNDDTKNCSARSASFQQCRLINAIGKGINFTDAKFNQSLLLRANLEGATFFGANFTESQLILTNLNQSKFNIKTKIDDCIIQKISTQGSTYCDEKGNIIVSKKKGVDNLNNSGKVLYVFDRTKANRKVLDTLSGKYGQLANPLKRINENTANIDSFEKKLNFFDEAIVSMLEGDEEEKFKSLKVQLDEVNLEERLSLHYKKLSKWERFDGSKAAFNLRDNFVNVAIVHQHEQTKVIKLKNMFQAMKEVPLAPTQLMVLGRAGIGKTMLTRYLGYRCMAVEDKSQRLWSDKFDMVFVLPLRLLSTLDLKSLAKKRDKLVNRAITLTELVSLEFIYQACLSDNHKTVDDRREDPLYKEQYRLLQTVLEAKKDKILYVLDGYDEVVSLVKDSKLLQAVLDELLGQKYLIVTSRPYAKPELKSDKDKHRVLEHVGFQEADVKSYITRYFKSTPKQGELLKSFLNKNPGIKGISHIPIQLELLCHTWQERLRNNKTLSAQLGMTELYGELLHNTAQIGMNRLSGNLKESALLYSDVIKFLEFLAYTAMIVPGVPVTIKMSMLHSALESFNKKHKSSVQLFNILKLGLLKGVGGSSFINRDYYFLHLTFQEYFAARYLVCLLTSKDSKAQKTAYEFIRRNKYKSQYEVVMWFMAGLLKDSTQGLKLFWEAYLAEPRDLTGIRHRLLMMRCLEECWQDTPWDKAQFNTIAQQLSVWVSDKLVRRYGENIIYDHNYTVLINEWFSILSYTPKVFKGLYEESLQKYLVNQKTASNFRLKLIDYFIVHTQCSKAWVSKNLLPLSKDEHRSVRRNAPQVLATWLKQGGQLSEQAVKEWLLPILKEEDSSVRKSAIEAFTVWLAQGGKVSEKVATDTLLPLLKDEDWSVRQSATEIFGSWLSRYNPGRDFWLNKKTLSSLATIADCLYIQKINPQLGWFNMNDLLCYTINFSSDTLGEHFFKATKNQKEAIEKYFYLNQLDSPLSILKSDSQNIANNPLMSLFSSLDYLGLFTQSQAPPKITIYDAAKEGDMEALIENIEYDYKLVDTPNVNGIFPIHFAAMNGHKNIVKKLIEKNANVNSVWAYDGTTALHYAIAQNKLNIIEILLNTKTINPFIKNKYGIDPIDKALNIYKNNSALGEKMLRLFEAKNFISLDETEKTIKIKKNIDKIDAISIVPKFLE